MILVWVIEKLRINLMQKIFQHIKVKGGDAIMFIQFLKDIKKEKKG